MTEATTLYYPERTWRASTHPKSVWAGLVGRTVVIEWAGIEHPQSNNWGTSHPEFHDWILHEVMDADDDWVVLKRVGKDARGGPVVVRLDEIDHATVEG